MQWSPGSGWRTPSRTDLAPFRVRKVLQVPDYSRFYENAQYDIAVRERSSATRTWTPSGRHRMKSA